MKPGEPLCRMVGYSLPDQPWLTNVRWRPRQPRPRDLGIRDVRRLFLNLKLEAERQQYVAQIFSCGNNLLTPLTGSSKCQSHRFWVLPAQILAPATYHSAELFFLESIGIRSNFSVFWQVFAKNARKSEVAISDGFLLNDKPGLTTNSDETELNQGEIWT